VTLRRRTVAVVLSLVAAVGVIGAASAWYRGRLSISTDDAYVEATVAPISAKVAGQVVEVLVRDNQVVAAGQVLVRLDPRDYKARVEQGRASVLIAERRHRAAIERIGLGREMAASQKAQARAATIRADAASESATSVLESSRAAVKSRVAALASAQADRDRARALHDRAAQDLGRARELFSRELVARQFVDYAETEERAAAAQLASGEQRVSQAQRDLESSEADARMREAGFEPQQIGLRTAQARVVEARALQIQADALLQEVKVREAERELAQAQLREAEADLSLALLNLEHCEIKAPAAGVIARKNVELGQVVQTGQPLVAVVSLDDVWVVANFKETQLRRVRAGLRADVVVDTFPDRAWAGSVDSISAGTGSRFSLLPPENASGNWVKVVQRIPVKVVFDAATIEQHVLRPGMSAVVTIRLR